MNETTDMLSRINGIVAVLFWLPTSGQAGGAGLDNVEGWQVCYERQGLSFGRSKDDAAVLRDLVRVGLIESVGGKTKASSFRLTWRGLLASLPGDGVTAKELLVALETIGGMQDRSKIILAGSEDRRIVMGWELCPAAGQWFTRYAKSFAAYNAEFTRWDLLLMPMLVMGWIRRFTDCYGVLWAVELTDAGRKALKNPPDLTIQTGTAHDFDAWEAGWSWGASNFISTPAPAWTGGIVSRRLPASAWC